MDLYEKNSRSGLGVKNIRIGIIDYGVGNHSSVHSCLRKMGYLVQKTNNPHEFASFDILILPGVGAFPPAMKRLKEGDLCSAIKDFSHNNGAIIGICLGMQLLTGCSYEHGYTEGLGLIPGEIVPFPDGSHHIGWNTVEKKLSNKLFNEENNECFYFNHSYIYEGEDLNVAYTAEHKMQFPAVICNKKIIGIQFHPEKSQDSGIRFLKKIIENIIHD